MPPALDAKSVAPHESRVTREPGRGAWRVSEPKRGPRPKRGAGDGCSARDAPNRSAREAPTGGWWMRRAPPFSSRRAPPGGGGTRLRAHVARPALNTALFPPKAVCIQSARSPGPHLGRARPTGRYPVRREPKQRGLHKGLRGWLERWTWRAFPALRHAAMSCGGAGRVLPERSGPELRRRRASRPRRVLTLGFRSL
jgi:hypothetical protein